MEKIKNFWLIISFVRSLRRKDQQRFRCFYQPGRDEQQQAQLAAHLLQIEQAMMHP